MDKAARENQALRAASEAVKLMALSQGVHCPIPKYTDEFKNQCEKPVEGMKEETTRQQFQRSFVYIKSVRQGVKPPLTMARLPDHEIFLKEIKDILHNIRIKYYTLDEWISLFNKSTKAGTLEGDKYAKYICRDLLRINIDDYNTVSSNYTKFIDGGGAKTALCAHHCKTLRLLQEGEFHRFLGYLGRLELEPKYLDWMIENSDAISDSNRLIPIKGNNIVYAMNVLLTNDIKQLTIRIIDKGTRKRALIFKEDSDRHEDNLITMVSDLSASSILIGSYKQTFYICVDDSIDIPGLDNIAVVDISNQSIISDIFKRNVVTDVHPYLMYLLQTDPWCSRTFMVSSFGGNMAPPLKFKLAYYIVAHYVATHDVAYKENPSVFYKLPDSEKIPKMIAALQKNKCIQDDLLTAGYRWLNRESVKEVRPSMKELIDTRFGSGLGALKLKGGKRQTRKVRFR